MVKALARAFRCQHLLDMEEYGSLGDARTAEALSDERKTMLNEIALACLREWVKGIGDVAQGT